MTNNIKISRSIIVTVTATLILLLGIVLVFIPSQDQVRRYPNGGLGDFLDISYYQINPETILLSLDRGEVDVFLPELVTPDAPAFKGSIAWHQSDYMRIVDALFRFIWNETLDSWNLYYVQFEANCRDNQAGFRLADFLYFKSISINGKRVYSTREMLITPEYGDVSVGEGTNFPQPLLGWKRIQLAALRLTADDALEVAEQNGGKEFRSNANDNCTIGVNLNPNVDREDWLVFYSSTESSSIYIDPYTGQVIK